MVARGRAFGANLRGKSKQRTHSYEGEGCCGGGGATANGKGVVGMSTP